MRGASALRQVLAAHPQVRAFVVWEPVLRSDEHAPGAEVALTDDPHVHRYWDPQLLLSRRLLGEATQRHDCLDGGDTDAPIVWDAVFVFPPGARWKETLPPSSFCGRTVVGVQRALDGALPR